MPEYAFYCRDCRKAFSASMSIREHDRKVAPCPRCGKRIAVEKRLATGYVVTSKKS